ncbi:hypothetical protein H0B56_15230 [Haloechinothrix sp. YIM 98757]|uniref:Uncharacterized protein n=1 Tax=Haloechinothrix aidingensis TaxID=2752311 RepID=A0A838ACB5_9PSEU|nr:hypothetical protein [Haloechinothrix aidingensis]MBA0126902.1 hypothetical protein [Haloechinothrix aidingensis]
MFWLWLLLLFALPFLTLVPWDRARGWLLSRRWQHDPHDTRPRMVATRDGYELDRGGL